MPPAAGAAMPQRRRPADLDKAAGGADIAAMPAILLALLVCLVTSGAVAAGSETPRVKICILGADGKTLPPQQMDKVIKTEAEWRAQLGDGEVYEVARGKGTERPFCGAFHDHKKPGIYLCVCCDLPLFRSDAKFDSGTGWPSFFQPVAPENITTQKDFSHGMVREEILCTRCDAHLGHVFPDGPPPTGLRYCVNSVSLKFVPEEKP